MEDINKIQEISSEKNWFKKHPIATGVIIFFGFIFFINSLSGSSSNTTNSSQPTVNNSTAQSAPLLKLESSRFYQDGAGEKCANGEVANISTQSLGFVQANISFRNKDGNLINPSNTYLGNTNLLPGQKTTFEDCESISASSGIVLSKTTITFSGKVGDSSDIEISYSDTSKISDNVSQSRSPQVVANSTSINNLVQNSITQATSPALQTDNQNTSPVSSETISQKNAVKKAKSYLGYSAFSHDGLVAQLEYEQFSHAEAVYGADNSGANWTEQAAEKAKSYMEHSAFSRGSLITQLEYEKFTQAQAEYGANAVGL